MAIPLFIINQNVYIKPVFLQKDNIGLRKSTQDKGKWNNRETKILFFIIQCIMKRIRSQYTNDASAYVPEIIQHNFISEYRSTKK